MQSPGRIYERRKIKYAALLQRQQEYLRRLGNYRLLIFSVGLASTIFLYFKGFLWLSILALVISCGIFIWLLKRFDGVKERCAFTQALIKVNERSLQRISGRWTEFSDTGEEYLDNDHPYAPDLDIFGKGSLFQWLNSCRTRLGRQNLAHTLCNPLTDIDEIVKQQEAIAELSAKLSWRQRMEAEGQITAETKDEHNAENLTDWAEDCSDLYCQKWLRILTVVLPAVTILTLIAAFGFNFISGFIPVVLILFHILLLFWRRRERVESLELVYGYRVNIKVYRGMLNHLEGQRFKSERLRQIQGELQNKQRSEAWRQIDELDKLTDSAANRYNLFYILFNILFLWDYQAMIRLEKWKQNSGRLLAGWLKALGMMEMMSSLAQIGFENREWALPEFTTERNCFSARQIGHPLITEGRVCNDLQFAPGTQVLMITGSNMSGKSTLLRTVGVNMVLAYLGTPVCAEQMRCSLQEIHSSMRTSDNLEKNYSSFYAELLRIKTIVDAVNEGHKVFFLLDEIFKGTNSYDRHIGAKVLIKQLIEGGAMGMVSTHDLELAELANEESGRVANYNFCEYYSNDQIFFDYKLREGVSRTRNALPLLKMMGIRIDDEYLKESNGL